jgi:hypothetical protein
MKVIPETRPFMIGHCYGYGVKRHFQQYFSYIVTVSFIGGGKRSNWGKALTCRKREIGAVMAVIVW